MSKDEKFDAVMKQMDSIAQQVAFIKDLKERLDAIETKVKERGDTLLPDELIEDLVKQVDLLEDGKAGRTLSAANLARLKKAKEAVTSLVSLLDELLKAGGGSEEEDDDEEGGKKPKKKEGDAEGKSEEKDGEEEDAPDKFDFTELNEGLEKILGDLKGIDEEETKNKENSDA